MTVSQPAKSRTAELLRTTPMPSRIRALPRNKVGYPIPFFAATIDGARDFRVGDPDAYLRCINERLCWVCGQRRPAGGDAFVVGPMCVVNLISQDPPSHVDCAEYAARVCPFMAVPNMDRRERGLPDTVGNAGIAITRNPGVCAIVVAPRWKVFRPEVGGEFGVLFSLGAPARVSWWSESRRATRDEVLASIDSGLPLLYAQCDKDENPAASRAALQRQHRAAMRLVPAG